MTNAELRQLDAEADSHQADADAHRARLAVASARSYARNTRDPLAAAEGDLLGEALKVLADTEQTLRAVIAAHEAEPFRTHLDPAQRFQHDLRNRHEAASALLARAKGGTP